MIFRCLFPLMLIFLFSFRAYALSSRCPDIASSSAINTPQQLAEIIGLATDPESQQPLYCEYHYFSPEDGRQVLVEYRDLEQNLIASKQLRYSASLVQPEVFQEDFRHGELRQVFLVQGTDTQVTEIKVVYLEPESKQTKQVNLVLEDNVVIDAGFDAAVRDQWQKLVGGEIIEMDFLSPVHLRTFNLSVRSVAAEDCNVKLDKPDSQQCFMIRPSNAFINLLAKPLWLVYEKETQRLLTYKGNVNITTLAGDTLSAKIRYHYR